MKSLQNIAIAASAGSGKTYNLTNRFIYLLHLTEQPERIIALTFTRSAAGEFFHHIIQKLATAAASEAGATELSSQLQIDADRARYHTLLSCVIQQMHRLNLQTLDSFFFRMVSAFSLELGLPGNLNLMDEGAELRMRKEARDHIIYQFDDSSSELNEFWHAFRQATYGQDTRRVEGTVSGFIKDLYSHFLEAPDPEKWGQMERIWPKQCQWAHTKRIDWEQLAEAWLTCIPEGLSRSQENDFHALADKVRAYGKNEKTTTLIDRAIAQADELFAGQVTLRSGRGKNNLVPLTGRSAQALAAIVQAIFWHHLHRALQNTQGVYRVLQAYHQSYDRIVRRPGRLAFADLTHLLAPAAAGSPLAQMDADSRALMDFRLDGHYDHWLFDEFQDTSRSQWQVVETLIDEVVQDDSGQRSLFYVGDTKQCLYLWRNSDDRLFHEIRQRYSNIEPQSLSTSWRSAPAILDAVNEVFEDPALIAETFSPDAAERWQRSWEPHVPSPKTQDLSGYACWMQVQKNDSPTRNEQILQLLETIQPIQRGMSVGILVRKNAHANEIAAYLREHSNFPVHTGSAIQPATDNAAGAALLAMLRCAAHPGDAHARGFLRCIDASTEGVALSSQTDALRQRLLQDSHESAVRWACDAISQHLPQEDERHRQRLQTLIEAARRFDREEQRSIDALIHYLKDSKSGECAPGDAIIVETIHKSKGLEYDLVLLINEDTSVRNEQRISPKTNPQGETDWLMEPIKKELMQADPQLSQLHDQTKSQSGFGRLCALYVGMTRAKRGLYMISDLERVSQGSTVHYLRERLGSTATANGLLWETGDPNWAESFQAEASPSEAHRTAPVAEAYPAVHPRLQLMRPSSSKQLRIPARTFFDLSETASEFGTAVHDAFEQIEWWQPSTLDTLGAKIESAAVRNCIEKCFQNPAIRAHFTCSDADAVVWREKAFSLIDEQQLINGVFDRVQLYRSPSGDFDRAVILDFKTDRIHPSNTLQDATEKHRPQMEAYRKALAALTGIPQGTISLLLVFTAPAECVEL
jgi:ATP-dependent exoDNAse (exonuclease V) beta subunit